MISYVKGILTEKNPDSVTVEAGRIGWSIRVPVSALSKLPPTGNEVKIYTYMQVKEDDISLFGFLEKQDLEMFRRLIGVSGVGPKGALAILGALSPAALRSAIFTADAKAIARAPGIGTKTAQRIVLDLRDSVKPEDILPGAGGETYGAETVPMPEKKAAKEAVDALTALGYGPSEAVRAVGRVTITPDMTTEQVLRASLKYLSIL